MRLTNIVFLLLNTNMETSIIKDFSVNHNFSDINYKEPVRCANGSICYVSLKDNNHIIIETPYLKVKKNSYNNNCNKSYYYLQLYLTNSDIEKDFFHFLYDIEDYNLMNIKKNCMSWFNQNIPDDILYKNQKNHGI